MPKEDICKQAKGGNMENLKKLYKKDIDMRLFKLINHIGRHEAFYEECFKSKVVLKSLSCLLSQLKSSILKV